MKTMTQLKLLASTLAVLATLALPHTSQAGNTTPEAPSCVKNADGSGYCHGSLEGFRGTANSTDYVQFQENLVTGSGAFYASLNGVNYSCSPNSGSTSRFSAALAARGYFYVAWDSTGSCYNFWVSNESNSL